MSYDLQALYDSEINFKLFTFWDAGFDWWLGDEMNGYLANGCADTYTEACQEICEAAIKYWPSSKFAKNKAEAKEMTA